MRILPSLNCSFGPSISQVTIYVSMTGFIAASTVIAPCPNVPAFAEISSSLQYTSTPFFSLYGLCRSTKRGEVAGLIQLVFFLFFFLLILSFLLFLSNKDPDNL